MAQIVEVAVTPKVLQPDFYKKMVNDPAAGAIVLFSGEVRNHDQDKSVTSLEYEAHPDAQNVMRRVIEQTAAKYDLIKVAAAHRFGPISIGECAFVVCVSAAHRQAAFDACQEIVDEVKLKIPIWKHQVFADGTDEWVNFA